MASIFDLDFNSLTVSPFGFDTLFTSGGASIGTIGGTSGGVADPKHGVGVRVTGQTISIHNTYPETDLEGLGMFWCDVEQTPGTYTWLTRNGGTLVSPDASIDDAATEGYVLIMRLFGGVNMPIGGAGANSPGNGNINWASKNFTHQGDSFGGVERVSFVSKDISLTQNTYIPWAGDPTLRVLYQRILIAMNTWLNGTTGGGHRRGDYVIYVPVFMATENGTEMAINFQSGTFKPTAAIKMDNGISYGPGTGNLTGDVGTINRACVYSHIPSAALPPNPTSADKLTYVQNLWIQAWKDSTDIQAAAVPNADMGIAYEGIWGGGKEQTAGVVRDYVTPLYGKTKLFAQTTNYTVDWNAYSPALDAFINKVIVAGGKVGFQTQAVTPTNSNPGMKPADWADAMEQGLDRYKMHFMETQAQDLGDNTYGPNNLKYINAYGTVLTAPSPALSGTAVVLHSGEGANFPAVPFEAIVWPASVEPGGAVAYEIVQCTARSGDTFTIVRNNNGAGAISIAANYQMGVMKYRLNANANDWAASSTQTNALEFIATATDQAYARKVMGGRPSAYYLLEVNRLVSNAGTIILLFSTDDAGGSVQVRLTTGNAPRIVVSGVADYTSATGLQNGDILELYHVINGAQSGYIFRINKTEVHRNLTIAAGSATGIATVDAGLKSKIVSDIRYSRFAADDATWPSDPVAGVNLHAPIIDLVSFG